MQKRILDFLREENKDCCFREIKDAICQGYFVEQHKAIPSYHKVRHQLDLLLDDDAVEKYDDPSFPLYRLKAWGHKKVEGGLGKYWYWLINKKHNLYSFLAFIVSLIALTISIIAIL